MLLKAHFDGQANADVFGFAVDDQRGEPHQRILVDGHQPDHIGRRHLGEPLLVIHRNAHDGAATRNGADFEFAAATRANGARRVNVLIASGTELKTQVSVGTARPKEFALGGQRWEWSHGDRK